MKFSRLAALAILALALPPAHAAAPTPSPTPLQPVPNPTSLRPLAGKYTAGRAKVTIEMAPTYRGGSRLYATAFADNTLKIRLVGWVLAPAGRVPIDNLLTFLPTGKMKGRNLSPGIARRAPVTGIYTAAGRKITFNGNFQFDATGGTFSGTVQRNGHGRLFVVYSVFIAGASQPAYTYNYSATRPRR
jgi:hypothetical protein